nr:hypothetical protein CFP56_00114 [Quercus suber]
MGRFKKYVYIEEAMEKFIADYRIPSNVGLRYCEDGDWLLQRLEGEVVIPIVAFLEGGIRIPMGILGCVDALNEKMGLRLTHHDVNWFYNLQLLKGKSYYLKTRDDRVRLIQCLPEFSKGLNEEFLIVSGEWHDGLHCPTMEGIPDPHAFERHFHLVNQEDLQKVLRASVYINEDDNQVRAAYKILGYTPVQKSFSVPKHVIRANDPRLQKITVTEDEFQFPEELSELEVVTVALPSSSQVFIEAAEEDPVREEDAFDVFAQLDYPSSANDGLQEEAHHQLVGPDRRPTGEVPAKASPPPSKTKSTSAQQKLPPPPSSPPSQMSLPSESVPADPKKKKDKGKRLMEDKPVSSQEEENTLRLSKQLKTGGKSQDRQVDTTSSEAHAWLSAPMLHGEPLKDDASLRDFNEGEGAHVADALERCLLLPADMAELDSMRGKQVFLSLKRYLGMAIQAVYRLEGAANDQGKAP